jgi:general secretion pathway protein H
MPTSVPGSRARPRRPLRGRGFSLLELLIVIAIIALSTGLVTLALRDGKSARLEEEGARLAALLEMARAEARVSGVTVRWVPLAAGSSDDGAQFRFIGLAAAQQFPTRWLDAATTAQVLGTTTLVLGPQAILPPQRVLLQLADRRLELASDGLGPFAAAVAADPAAGR